MGDININGDNNTVTVGERRGIGIIGTFFLLVVLAWLIKHILVVLAVVAVLGLVFLIGWVVMLEEEHREKEAAKRRAIAARAEAQHHAILEGDTQLGTYGEYPPAV